MRARKTSSSVRATCSSTARLPAGRESLAWRLRRDNGIAWDEFSQDELRQLDPNLSRDYIKGVVVRENGHTTNPHRLVGRLAHAFQRDGGRIERRRAVGFELADGLLTAVRCADG